MVILSYSECKVIHLSLKMNLVSHKMSKTPLRSSSEMWRATRIRFSFYLPLQGIQNNVCPYKETNDSKQISSFWTRQFFITDASAKFHDKTQL